MPANKQWADNIRKKWMKRKNDSIEIAPIVIGGEELFDKRVIVDVLDKSQLKDNIICGKYTVSTPDDLKRAVDVAAKDPDKWRSSTYEYRLEMLSKVANKFREKRLDLIGVSSAEVGKVILETDVEVSEAVDFLEFYSHSVEFLKNLKI